MDPGPDAGIRLAAAQLARMRGMNGRYHDRFFGDIRFTIVVSLGLFTAGALVDPRLHLAVPVVTLIGAAQTAFDASYLIFSRHYARWLERWLDERTGEEVLIAHRLEDDYLFPLDRPKIVTLAGGNGFTWFGFMTAFYTLIGAAVYLVGYALGVAALRSSGQTQLAVLYTLALGTLTLATVGVGWWWFVAGTGERRLRAILDQAAPE